MDKRQQAYLSAFVEESNAIESIFDSVSHDLALFKTHLLLAVPVLNHEDLCRFNDAGRPREYEGLNVWIGQHIPPPGGPLVLKELNSILTKANAGSNVYQIHQEFEALHPFTDGNGRTGRALWLWQMVNQQGYDISLGFLHKWYYQSLDNSERTNVLQKQENNPT